MERIDVESSNLKSIGYDSKKKLMEVEFRGSGVYIYYNIPETIFVELLSARSKGTYFNRIIKRGGYTYKKVEESNPTEEKPKENLLRKFWYI